jgi:hypothetical protein
LKAPIVAAIGRAMFESKIKAGDIIASREAEEAKERARGETLDCCLEWRRLSKDY